MKIETSNKIVEKAIDDLLSKAGFKRKGKVWYVDNAETFSLLELQKSNYGDQYYINLAVFVKKLGSNPFPKEHQCHVRGRLTSLLKDKSDAEKSLDLENVSIPMEKRIASVSSMIKDIALPLLSEMRSMGGIKRLLIENKLEEFLVSLKLKKLLGIDEE